MFAVSHFLWWIDLEQVFFFGRCIIFFPNPFCFIFLTRLFYEVRDYILFFLIHSQFLTAYLALTEHSVYILQMKKNNKQMIKNINQMVENKIKKLSFLVLIITLWNFHSNQTAFFILFCWRWVVNSAEKWELFGGDGVKISHFLCLVNRKPFDHKWFKKLVKLIF